MNNELPLDFLAASYGLKSDDADTCDFCGNISGKDNLFAGIEASICVECAGLAKFTIDSLKGKLKTNRRMIMNKYRDKSDFEINKAVAVYLGYTAKYENESVTVFRNNNGGMPLVVSATADGSDNFDPCNNPSDAMPIVIENGISLIKEDDHYIAASTDVGIEGYIGAPELMLYGLGWLSKDKNPYRAAMEVFLMMKDAENEK
ncbi:TPA: phage protein NinX family protein [Morganella morganii]